MAATPTQPAVLWHDLTVPNADEVHALYAAVLGASVQPVSMGDYEDYSLVLPGGDGVGICHARGPNADAPAVWMCYFSVPDLDVALAEWTSRGGDVLGEPRAFGASRFATVRDPAGAVCALFQP